MTICHPGIIELSYIASGMSIVSHYIVTMLLLFSTLLVLSFDKDVTLTQSH